MAITCYVSCLTWMFRSTSFESLCPNVRLAFSLVVSILSVAGINDMKFKLAWPSFICPVSLHQDFLYFSFYLNSFQGILAYGLSRISTPSLAGWRWIYIIEGAITVFAASVAWFFLVDFPQKAKFLRDEERVRVVERLNKDRGDGEHDQITGAKILLHLSDWKLWGFALIVPIPPTI